MAETEHIVFGPEFKTDKQRNAEAKAAEEAKAVEKEAPTAKAVVVVEPHEAALARAVKPSLPLGKK